MQHWGGSPILLFCHLHHRLCIPSWNLWPWTPQQWVFVGLLGFLPHNNLCDHHQFINSSWRTNSFSPYFLLQNPFNPLKEWTSYDALSTATPKWIGISENLHQSWQPFWRLLLLYGWISYKEFNKRNETEMISAANTILHVTSIWLNCTLLTWLLNRIWIGASLRQLLTWPRPLSIERVKLFYDAIISTLFQNESEYLGIYSVGKAYLHAWDNISLNRTLLSWIFA